VIVMMKIIVCLSLLQQTYCGRKYGVEGAKPKEVEPAGLETLVDWDKPGGHKERHRVVQALLKYKADPNKLDFLDFTALHYACMLGWKDTVELLLSNGAEHDQVNAMGVNALMFAVKVRGVDNTLGPSSCMACLYIPVAYSSRVLVPVWSHRYCSLHVGEVSLANQSPRYGWQHRAYVCYQVGGDGVVVTCPRRPLRCALRLDN